MGRSQSRSLLSEERHDIHDFLADLSDEEWATPSLCADWSVLEVAAHLASSLNLTRAGVIKRGLRYGTGTAGANRRAAAAWGAGGPSSLVDGFANPDLLGLGYFYPGWALAEAVVHHQDMRRALGHHRIVPVERLRVALRALVRVPTGTGANRRRRGVHLQATDLDWSLGRGPEVVGAAESILMALAGRREALEELEGPGAGRFGGS